MTAVFLLLPGICGWEIVDVDGDLPAIPLTSGSLQSGPEPVARTTAGPTPSIRNREPRK